MNKIYFYEEDAEECIKKLNQLAEDINSDIENLKKFKLMSGSSADSVEETEKLLKDCFERIKKAADVLVKAADKYNQTEEILMNSMRSIIRVNEGNGLCDITVERSSDPSESLILGGNRVKREDWLERLILLETAGKAGI